jgi:hypothetical protein
MTDMRTQAIIGVIPPDVGEAVLASRWPSVAAYGSIARRGQEIQARARELFMRTIKLPFLLAALLLLPVTALAFFIALAGWLLLAPFYFVKIFPGLATRYTLTNKRLLIERDLFFGKHNTMNPMVSIPLAGLVLTGWLLLLPFFLGRIFTALFLVQVLKQPAEKYLSWYRLPTYWKRLEVAESMNLTEIKEVRILSETEQPFYLAADMEIISTGGQKLLLRGVPEFHTFKRNIDDAWLAWGRKEGPKDQLVPASAPVEKGMPAPTEKK